MPGPVSDSYDSEWGTASNGDQIREALQEVYDVVSQVLGNKAPIYILDLVRLDAPDLIDARLTEKEWRLIRFALERARAFV